MVDYRDDWKYSKPPKIREAQARYSKGWERVFGKRSTADKLEPETETNETLTEQGDTHEADT